MLLLIFVYLTIFNHLVLGVNVSIPLVPLSSAPLITPSLVSFSIEQDRWTDWAGTTSRNQFFFNVLNNLNQLSGVPPRIRIGADSEDHTNFNPAVQFSEDVFPAITPTVPYPEASSIVVGDSYYESTQFLPPNTRVTWGLNLGQNNLTDAFLEARSIVKAFSSSAVKGAGIVLDSIEIGNEADLYKNNGARPTTFTSSQYVADWTKFATNISAVVGISSSSATRFWSGAFSGSSHSTTGFSPQAIISEGILSSAPGSAIATISQHHYSGSFCSGSEGLLQDLMEKSSIRANLSPFSPDITAVRAKGLDYVLGETNSYSCHGAPGVSNTAGAALWALDYVLFATQVGVSRVFFHEGVGYKYNLIQPITLTRSILDGSTLPTPIPAHIQPQYYAAIIAAESIGKSGNTHAAELSINNSQIAGYAFYDGAHLARAVFINSNAFLKSNTAARPSIHLDFGFTGSGSMAPTSFTIKRLNVGHADDTAGLTWGGQTYETSDGKVSGSLEVSNGKVVDGVDIQATEVVLLTFGG
ncbi:hypothetical protein BDZ94DRAFT_170407 [Collybia nuda]|uniref:Beta-glucuronidase C-terminal domain-containing protein n=1 Tax=Collybia nuda TaxID=64659 RepID=A0A9P5YD59_9AGAR|nr:hypothetical protein BDZ94DRAFT_170407 [Collybia nuda]